MINRKFYPREKKRKKKKRNVHMTPKKNVSKPQNWLEKNEYNR